MAKKGKKEMSSFHIPGWIMLVLILFFVLLMYDLLFGISFSRTQYLTTENISLEIPKFMSISRNEKQKIRFETYRSMAAISKDMKRIRKNYQRISCSDQVYYYNEKDNYSMTYQINRGFLVNYLDVEYRVGKAVCPEFKEPEASSISRCQFRRTYFVDLVKSSDSSKKIYVTLSEYEGSTETIEIPDIWADTLEPAKSYVFTFEQVGDKKATTDTISDLFTFYVVSDIQVAEIVGMGQIFEPVCESSK